MTDGPTQPISAPPPDGASESPFPLRVAAVDVGSNAIRFIAAEFSSRTEWADLAYRREAIRLGHSAFLTGELTQAAVDAAVGAFEGFRDELHRLGIRHVRAVATSAVRESRNGDDLVRRVREASGIHLSLISGVEEARLVWLAARQRIDLGDGKWMLVDLGGGSVEVSLADASGIMWSESHRMGSVRLLEELAGADDAPAHFANLLAEYASTLRIPHAAKHWTPVQLIATGGNIESLAKMTLPEEAADPAGPVLTLPRERLRETIGQLARLSYAQRVGELGLREDRADVILPAAVVYDRVAELAGADEILVPGVGVKEGVLLDLVDELTSEAGLGRQERIVYEGAVSLGRRYLFDEAHGRHVTDLSLALFDQLPEVHGLAPEDRRILIAAAMLHDIGQHISYRKHHKHSLYLILHSELPGISPSELPLVALVARYHRRADPQPGHYLFSDMDKAQQDRVERLSAVLRLADALDREHLQRVHSLQTRVHDSGLELHLAKDGPLLLEQWALRAKGALFSKVLGLEPYVTFEPSDCRATHDSPVPV